MGEADTLAVQDHHEVGLGCPLDGHGHGLERGGGMRAEDALADAGHGGHGLGDGQGVVLGVGLHLLRGHPDGDPRADRRHQRDDPQLEKEDLRSERPSRQRQPSARIGHGPGLVGLSAGSQPRAEVRQGRFDAQRFS